MNKVKKYYVAEYQAKNPPKLVAIHQYTGKGSDRIFTGKVVYFTDFNEEELSYLFSYILKLKSDRNASDK